MSLKKCLPLVFLLCTCVAAAAPRLETLEVTPNPVPLESGKTGEVVISVTIERPTPLDVTCDAVIAPGDGGKFLMSWSVGDRRTKTARYQYNRAGNYRVKVSGTGQHACTGVRELTVVVGSSPQGKAPASRCPAGWTLQLDSVRGSRFTCRANPPAQALKCADGTSYYAERGEIGCR